MWDSFHCHISDEVVRRSFDACGITQCDPSSIHCMKPDGPAMSAATLLLRELNSVTARQGNTDFEDLFVVEPSMDYDENCTEEEELNDDSILETMQVVETSEPSDDASVILTLIDEYVTREMPQVFHDSFKLFITQLQSAASNEGWLIR